MTTPRRPSTWIRWVPVLVVVLAVLVGSAWLLSSSRTFQEGSAAPVPPKPATTSSSAPSPHSSGSQAPHSGLPTIAESALPKQAKDTLALIRAGGPYPYRQDNGVFGNRERLLPTRASGYYREYTVVTPGETDRGPRRIIAGHEGDLYWSTDHYASFRQILEGQ